MRVSSLLTHSFDNEDNDSDELYFNHMGFWNIEVQYKNDEFKQYKTYFYAFNTFWGCTDHSTEILFIFLNAVNKYHQS